MSDWCILRCSGRNTLGLASSLRGGGYDTWTPVFVERRPVRRFKVEAPAPLLPTYVFARSMNLTDLLQVSADPMSRHPAFSVFHYLNGIPLIADKDLTGLRQIEERDKLNQLRRKPKARIFNPGEEVRVDMGAFTGMSGVVEQDDGKHVMVLFGRMSVKIATFMLADNRRAA